MLLVIPRRLPSIRPFAVPSCAGIIEVIIRSEDNVIPAGIDRHISTGINTKLGCVLSTNISIVDHKGILAYHIKMTCWRIVIPSKLLRCDIHLNERGG